MDLSIPRLKYAYTLAGHGMEGDLFWIQRPLVPTEDVPGTILLQALTDLVFSTKISKRSDGTFATPSIRDGKLHLVTLPQGYRQYSMLEELNIVATFDIAGGKYDTETRRFTAPCISGIPVTIEFGTYPVISPDVAMTICCPTVIGTTSDIPKVET